jgi:Cys-rich repeat protein
MNRNAAFRFVPMAALALALMGMGPGSCGANNPCEGLDEQSCLSTAGCQPLYFQPQCACEPCPAGVECPACSCGDYSFASCGVEAMQLPTDRCSGLSEGACFAEPGCEPVYFSADGSRCGSQDRCLGDYAGCMESPAKDECESLDEQACLARSECEAVYAATRCAADPSLRCVGPSQFSGCKTVSCEPVMCDLACAGGFAVDEHGCEICRCNRGCGSDADCGPGEVCEFPSYECPDGAVCGMPMGVCVQAQVRYCSADSDCQAGEVCRADPKDPCSAAGVYCLAPAALICQPACNGLDESACVARPDCRAERAVGCSAEGCVPDAGFRCVDGGQVCPAVACDLWCPNGFEVDQNGCNTCVCRGAVCGSDSDCASGEVCLFPHDVPTCPEGAACSIAAGVCAPAGSCLSDADCASGESCVFPMYGCAEGEGCPTPGYGFCNRIDPGCLSDADCGAGQRCVLTDCGPNADCYPYGYCEPAGCASDADCGSGERCELYDYCAAPDCSPYGVCVAAGCSSDADCASGHVCEAFATCDAIGCPPAPPSVCVDVECRSDADCAAGSVCRADPKDPCSQPGVECVFIARQICLAPCAGLDEASCVGRADCSANYVPGGGWCGNDMVFDSCSDH